MTLLEFFLCISATQFITSSAALIILITAAILSINK